MFKVHKKSRNICQKAHHYAYTFWLKIEQFWPFEEISIFSNGGLSLYCKNVQHVKIYLPCNFEVNPITHFDRLCKLEKRTPK
jgi:hypothetical protein